MTNRFSDSFYASLQRWLGKDTNFAELAREQFLGSPEKKMENARTSAGDSFGVMNAAPDEQRELLAGVLPVFINTAVMHTLGPLLSALSRTESPIEAAFLIALGTIARTEGYHVVFVEEFRHHMHGLESDWDSTLTIEPQARLGDYRVDFLLTFERHDVLRGARTRKTPDGREVIEPETVSAHMVVECDGHEFHEKTKEQASRDKLRDRTLQSSGYLVYRFSGSDLYGDAFKFADEAFSALKAHASARWREAEGVEPNLPASTRH